MTATNHNHIFHGKHPAPPGECYSCDRLHALSSARRIFELEDLLLFIEELYESEGSEPALRHLQSYIQTENLREKHKNV